jgi:restriction endonuclease S subunit
MKSYKLGDVCDLSKGKTITRATANEGEIPVIGGGLGPTYYNDVANRKPPVITVSASGANAGFVNYWNVPIWASDCTTIVEKPNSPASINYIHKYLQSRQEYINTELRRGSAQPHVYPSDIAELRIPLPSLEEQKEVVEKLDSIFAEIDLSYQKSTESLNYLSSCFDSFLDNILKNQILESGQKKMVDVLEIARGGSPRPISSYLTNAEDGVNWVKISDATSSKKYITETSQKIKPEGVSRSRLVNPGDFLLSNSMSFGRPYIMGTTGCIHDGWLVLSNDKKLLNQDYLYYMLGSKYIYDQFNRTAAGSTVRNLNISLAGQVTFPVPDLETQKSLVSQLIDFETSIDELKKSTADKLSKLQELKNSFLSSAFELNESSEAVA